MYESVSRNREEHVQEHVLKISNDSGDGTAPLSTRETRHKRGMILPFKPFAMAFRDIKYYVDMPADMRAKGWRKKGCSSYVE